jgi:2-phosphosulfolactate phosphatase
VIPAGEQWPGGGLRPALEDWLGAGSIIQNLSGRRSPEAEAAASAFIRFESDLLSCLRACSSGKELLADGRDDDVRLSAGLNESSTVPVLKGGAFSRWQAPEERE